MNEESPSLKNEQSPSLKNERSSSLKYAALFAAATLFVAGDGYLFWQLNRLQSDMADWRASMISEISQVRETSTAGEVSSRESLNSLRGDLTTARSQAAKAAGQARIDAQKHAEELAAKLEQEQQKQQQQQQEVATELTGVKEAATTAHAKIADVSNEVASTKSELSSAVSDLKRMTGDMGVMSGLIATNGKELATLKELGERNYLEFDLRKTGKPQRIGDISMILKKADPKRNKYTVDILADDRRVEKRDRNTNEPVQFYTGKARQPYELVVNEVKKDELVGYLAMPKVQMARR